MIVIAIKGFTDVLGAPQGWDPSTNGECFGLPVKIEPYGDSRSFTSAWKPDADEIAALLSGAEIHLRVIGGQPPVSLYVEGRPEKLDTAYLETEARREALLAKVVRLCGSQFAAYAALHNAKGTTDGDEKADANRQLAKICRDVLEGLALPPEQVTNNDGYVDAFYDLAKMMSIGARAQSPAEVWRTEMRPRLARALGAESR